MGSITENLITKPRRVVSLCYNYSGEESNLLNFKKGLDFSALIAADTVLQSSLLTENHH